MIRRALAALAFLFAPAAYASVTLTVSPTGSTTPTGAYVRMDIANCTNPTVVNSNTKIPVSRQFKLNGAASVTLTVEDNVTQIACNGNQLSYYTVTYVANGTQTQLKSVELPPGIFALENLAALYTRPWSPGIIQGPPGPAGCSLVSTDPDSCSANFSPRSLSSILFADSFTGSDIGAKINAAYTSVGGTNSGTSILSAEVNLSPGKAYQFSTPIRIGNISSIPYIFKWILDCHGSRLQWNGAPGVVPIMVLGENARDPYATMDVHNCIVDSGGITMPALMEIHGRLGFGVRNNTFEGANTATACVSMINTNDSSGPGYQEDWIFENNGWDGCTDDLAMHRGTGFSTDSMDYGWYIGNHWQLGAGQSGLHIYGDEGHGTLNVQGLHISGTTNTSGGASTSYTLKSDGGSQLISSFVDLGGENTGGNGFYDAVGTVLVSGSIHTRATNGIGLGAQITTTATVMPGKNGVLNNSNLAVGEIGFLGREYLKSKQLQTQGNQYAFYGAHEGAPEEQYIASFKLLDCFTSGGTPDVLASTVPCLSRMTWYPNGEPVYFGQGHGNEGGTTTAAPIASTQYGYPALASEGIAVTQGPGGTGEYGLKANGTTRLVEYTFNTPLDVSDRAGHNGTAFNGDISIPATTTTVLHVVNGRITGVN